LRLKTLEELPLHSRGPWYIEDDDVWCCQHPELVFDDHAITDMRCPKCVMVMITDLQCFGGGIVSSAEVEPEGSYQLGDLVALCVESYGATKEWVAVLKAVAAT
jgi:hypothetical protein